MGMHMSRPDRVLDGSPNRNMKKSSPKSNKGLRRHNTVGQILGSESRHEGLVRSATYGDVRHHLHGDLSSVSKRFNQVLGRSECLKEEKFAVTCKHDFQTKYSFTSSISRGRYATVTGAESCLTAKKVAVKIISKDKLYDRKSGKKCLGENVGMEVLALRNLTNQPNVVQFVDVFEDEAFFYVVMELCRGENLLVTVNTGGPMKEERAGPLLKQMLSVTERCHAHGIAHRDLKLENFVFESDKQDSPINVVDFGSAAFFKSGERYPFKGPVGTFNYMAPEVYDSRYGPSADVWSLGIIGYAILCGYLPFNASSNQEIMEKTKYEELGFTQPSWPEVSEGAKDLLRKMLEKNPDFRITIAEALSHPWIKQWDT